MRVFEFFNNCFREGRPRDRAQEMDLLLLMILINGYNWCKKRRLPFEVTETVTTEEEDIQLERISESHRTARAADVGVRGWSRSDMVDFKTDMEAKYGEFGAVSKKTGKKNLVEIEEHGSGPHCHVQISGNFSHPVKDFK